MALNLNSIREQFPGLVGDWVFLDNAGGTQVAKHVVDNINDYLFNTNVQLGASYSISQQSGSRVDQSQQRWTQAINAKHTEEVIFGSSTTALLQNLSKSLVQTFKPGDEVIVTNCDHEANIGPWVNMVRSGIVVKIWSINPDSYKLELDDLDSLMTDKTKLVAFTHVSNILGTINPVQEITKFIHERGSMVCVDGVAYAPHRLIDVQLWDVDFYVFSMYKVYGPHYSLLYGKREILSELPGINHYFIGKNEVPYKLQPGNVNYELTYGCAGVLDYFDDIYTKHFDDASLPLHSKLNKVFDLIAQYEEELSTLLINFLTQKHGIRIIGKNLPDSSERVPTVSFIVKDSKSSEIPLMVDNYKVGIRWGDFYARRLIDDLGLSDNDGVIRISAVHYNTIAEIEYTIEVLDSIL